MLERVKIQNFRCLRDVELELEPLTILVGPNASGKSASLDALDASTRYAGGSQVWRRRDDVEIERKFVDTEGHWFSPHDSGRRRRVEGLSEHELAYQKLQIDLDALRARNKASQATSLDRDGGNLTNVFATLSRDEQIEVRDEFCELVPVYSDVDTEPVGGGNLELRFEDRWSDVRYAPARVSDGSMLVLAYLVLQYQEESPAVVAVEEPERGLHPYLLEQLVTFFRQLATGDRGPDPFNLVLATHSAQLLEYAEPREVRLLDRDSDTGETVVDRPPVDDPDWDDTLEQYLDSLGHAWLSGGLGGVPGRR